MAELEFYVEFYGHWRESKKELIPFHSGVFCVYDCSYHPDSDRVKIDRLIYIGEAKNVREGISNHEKWDEWKQNIGDGKELCFSFGAADKSFRERVHAAFVFQNKPPLNDKYRNSFPFDKTTITARGGVELLITDFSVERTS